MKTNAMKELRPVLEFAIELRPVLEFAMEFVLINGGTVRISEGGRQLVSVSLVDNNIQLDLVEAR